MTLAPGTVATADPPVGPVLRYVHAVIGTIVSFEVRVGDGDPNAAHVGLARASRSRPGR